MIVVFEEYHPCASTLERGFKWGKGLINGFINSYKPA
jgi:hypothetical protein